MRSQEDYNDTNTSLTITTADMKVVDLQKEVEQLSTEKAEKLRVQMQMNLEKIERQRCERRVEELETQLHDLQKEHLQLSAEKDERLCRAEARTSELEVQLADFEEKLQNRKTIEDQMESGQITTTP